MDIIIQLPSSVEQTKIKKDAELNCPNCGSGFKRRTHRPFLLKPFLRLLNIRRYKCHQCSTKFYSSK